MEKTIYAKEYRALLEWLRNQRKRKGLTMRDLGARLDVHHSWIGRIEQGERRLDVAEYVRLCRAINVDAEQGIAIVKANLSPYPTGASTAARAAETRTEYSGSKDAHRRKKTSR